MARTYSSEIVAVITALEWDAAPTVSVLRFALYGGMYVDTENPSGPYVHYQGRIESDVILDKKIGTAFWKEDSGIDFGYIDISTMDQNDDIIDFVENVTIASVDLYRVNLTDPTIDQLSLIASTRSSDIGFLDENTARFRLESILQGGFNAPINSLYYDDTYPQLEGKPYPMAWGLIQDPQQILPTVFVDPVTLLYHITDLEITSFDSDIYDRGIALSEGTSGFDAVSNGFTLNQNPDGKITAGEITTQDPEDTSNALTGLFRLVRLAMTRGGVWDNAVESELTTLETVINMGDQYPHLFSDKVVCLDKFLDNIFQGTGSFYFVNELAEIRFGRLTDPDVESPALNFTDSFLIGEIRVDDDKAPGLSTRLDYARNPGVYDQDDLAGAVSNADRADFTNPVRTVETTEPVISFYEIAASRDPIELALSYSDSIPVLGTWSADETTPTADDTMATADGAGDIEIVTSTELALTEINRWWSDLYQKRRRFYSFDVNINGSLWNDTDLPQLGDFCTLQSDRFDLLETDKNLLIRRTKFNFSRNLLTIEGWG